MHVFLYSLMYLKLRGEQTQTPIHRSMYGDPTMDPGFTKKTATSLSLLHAAIVKHLSTGAEESRQALHIINYRLGRELVSLLNSWGRLASFLSVFVPRRNIERPWPLLDDCSLPNSSNKQGST